MKNKSILVFLLTSTCLFCGVKQKGDTNSEGFLSEITLVNGGNLDRCQVGELIASISRCSPKVIGVNFLFADEKNAGCDSVLATSIKLSGKVVLSEGFENRIIKSSNRIFTKNAFLTGVNGILTNENGVVDAYLRLTGDNEYKWIYSFPLQLAFQYDTLRSAELAAKSPARYYPFTINHKSTDFNIIHDFSNSNNGCEFIQQRIVIIGYLGPSNEDLLKTTNATNSTENTYSTVVLANAVLNILSDLKNK